MTSLVEIEEIVLYIYLLHSSIFLIITYIHFQKSKRLTLFFEQLHIS